MHNKEIAKMLKLTADLLELHDANPFKVRSYTNAAIRVDNMPRQLKDLNAGQIEEIEGIGKGMAATINEILLEGSTRQLNDLMNSTPGELLEILRLKGLGPKKVRSLWKELKIESIAGLLKACEDDSVAQLKGFGEKTQKKIKESLEYTLSNKGNVFFSTAEELYERLETAILEHLPDTLVSPSGAFRRKYETIDVLEMVCGTDRRSELVALLDKIDWLKKNMLETSPFRWTAEDIDTNLRVRIIICAKVHFYNKLLLHTGNDTHLSEINTEGKSLFHIIGDQLLTSEKEAYEILEHAYVEPELREGTFEIDWSKSKKTPRLLEYQFLKGTFHNHSDYSDGKNTIREMAEGCIEMGLQYLGLADHSKSAFYAGGLQEHRIVEQHAEIDLLNAELAPFRIFKGIESDILNDGALDYDAQVLSSFDFVVASIHSNLNMDKSKATTRLLAAISNPYTTFLGHPTGRLLLHREGYPIDHKLVIDACVRNNVIIEVNANPWRLDLDWRWIRYALDQGAMLSINPDAHEVAGLRDMYYGVCVARKGGLEIKNTFNAMDLEFVEKYLSERKKSLAQ